MNKFDINNLSGLLLLATPKVGNDPLFMESLIYIVKHKSDQGAEGIILNKPTKLPFYKLFNMVDTGVPINLSKYILEDSKVLIGGSEMVKSTFLLEDDLSYKLLTESVLEKLVSRVGQRKFEVAAGISSWDVGQLEREIYSELWITVACDKKVMFDLPYEQRYQSLVTKLQLDRYLQNMLNE